MTRPLYILAHPFFRLLTLLLTLLGACTPPNPGTGTARLVVLPGSLSLEAGAAPAYLEATVLGSETTVRWRLEGAGSLSTLQGKTTRYTPPETLNAPASAQIVASLEGTALEQTVPVQLKPATVMLALIPPKDIGVRVAAGSDPYTFSSQSQGIRSEALQWKLEGPGQLSSTVGTNTQYIPPTNLTQVQTATVKLSGGGVERSFSFQVTPRPTLSLSPNQLERMAGDASQVFTATLTYSNEPITFEMDGYLYGTLKRESNERITYTPPDALGLESEKTLILTARAGKLSSSATIRLTPKPRIRLDYETTLVRVSQGAFRIQTRVYHSSAPVTWSLEPNIGKLELGADGLVTYLPPIDLAQDTPLIIRARSSDVEGSIKVTVVPFYAARFWFNGYERMYREKLGIFLQVVTYPTIGALPYDISFFFNPDDPPERTGLNLSTRALNKPLALGNYVDAQIAALAEPGHPGLDFSSNIVQGCNSLTGQFFIRRLEYDTAYENRLKHLDATFSQTCIETNNGPASGRVVYGPLAEVQAIQP